MEKLIAKVNAFLSQFCIVCKVPCDKQMHFISGFIIAAVFTPFNGFYAVVVVAIIALLKENPDCKLYQMGYTIEEVKVIIAS
jgi:hypothetical protein